jgi:hypothetical protein
MGVALIAEMQPDPKWRGTQIAGTCPHGDNRPAPGDRDVGASFGLVGLGVALLGHAHRQLRQSRRDKHENKRDGVPIYNHGGTVVVASAWLAFYAIGVIHHLLASAH